MIERKSTVDQIEITALGPVQIRIALQIVDGDQVLSSKWHRTLIEHPSLAQAQMDAVNEHLTTQMGESAISQEDIDRIKAFCELSATFS